MIEQQILKNMRQKQGIYEPDKLARTVRRCLDAKTS